MVEFMFENLSPEVRNAYDEGNVEKAKELLLTGNVYNNVNATDGYYTLLYYFCSIRDRDMTRFLVEHGAEIDIRDNNGSTALMIASLNGKTEVVEYLISKGANVNVRSDGDSALMNAVDYRWVETVRLLLARGADVNVRNFLGKTPLMSAYKKDNAKGVNEEIIQLLHDKTITVLYNEINIHLSHYITTEEWKKYYKKNKGKNIFYEAKLRCIVKRHLRKTKLYNNEFIEWMSKYSIEGFEIEKGDLFQCVVVMDQGIDSWGYGNIYNENN